MLKILRRCLKHSPRVHIHEEPAVDLKSCVGLLDRFLDDNLRYGLEWDVLSGGRARVLASRQSAKLLPVLRPYFSRRIGSRYNGASTSSRRSEIELPRWLGCRSEVHLENQGCAT